MQTNVSTVNEEQAECDKLRAQIAALRAELEVRVMAQERLKESEARFSAICGAVTDYTYTVRVENGHAIATHHNTACQALTGYTPEEFAADPFLWIMMVVPDDRPAVEEQARRALAGDPVPPLEHRIIRKDGVQRWLRNTILLQRDPQGVLVAYEGLILDITQRKRVELQLLNLEQHHYDLMTAAPLGVFRSTAEGKLLEVNPAGARMMGYASAEELIATVNRASIAELLFVHPEAYAAMAVAAMKSTEWLEEEVLCRRRDGTVMVGRLRYRAIKGRGDETIGFDGFMEDISDRRQVEDVLLFLAHGPTSLEAEFFPRLARYLAESMEMEFIFINTLSEDGLSAKTLAVFVDGHFVDNLSYALKDTPCGEVVAKTICCCAAGVRHRFPRDLYLEEMGAESYVGTILRGAAGQAIGLIAAISRKPLVNPHQAEKILRLVSSRAAAELERQLAEDAICAALAETSRREREIAGLLLAARTLFEDHSFTDSVRAIFTICRERIGATAGYVAVLSADGKYSDVLFLEAGNRPCTVDPSLPMPIRGLRAQAYTLGSAVYDNDFPNSPWLTLMPAGHMTLDNVLFAPLIVNGTARGVIGIANKPGGFSDDDARLATAFGELAAVALNNSIHRDRRAAAEEALRGSEERLLTLFEYSPISIWEEDFSLVKERFVELAREGVDDWQGYFATHADEVSRCAALVKILDVNETSCRVFSAASKEELPRLLPLYFTERSLAVFAEELAALASGKRYFAREIPVRIPGDGGKELFLSLAVVPGHEEHLDRVLVSFIDITDRKRVEHELALSAERFDAILQTSLDGFWLVDTEGRIIEANQAYCQMSGYSREELIQLSVHDLEARDTAEEVQRRICFLIDNGYLCFESRHRRKDGTIFDVEASVHSLRGEQFLSFFRDISGRKRAEEELLHAKEGAESASRAKSEFLANMSHEIRTPMNAIIGLSELALGGELSPRLADYLEKINNSAHSLLGILNDILDFSKIEAERLHLEHLSFDLTEVMDSLPAMFGGMALAKGVEFRLDYGGHTPPALVGDPLRLRQILVNLVSNAIKFTEQGTVLVAIEVEEQGEEHCRLRFLVKDTGIGIAPEHLELIFSAFVQADSSATRQYGGTGLGLSISSRLAQLMGGTLEAQSTVGAGSTFALTLPFALDPQAAGQGQAGRGAMDGEGEALDLCPGCPTTPVDYGLAGARILLVEDNAINRQVAMEILAMANIEIEVAVNGLEAVTAVESGHYDAVLMDIQMPEMDGFTATAIIRGRLGRHDLPIIAMTAHAMAEHRKKCLAAGMNDFVSKPIDGRQLFALLGRWLRPRQPKAGAPPERVVVPPPVSAAEGGDGRPADAVGEQCAVLDVDDGVQRLMGNRALYLRLLAEFRQEYPAAGEEVGSMAGQGRLEEAKRLVHTVKGVAGNLGARGLRRAAMELEAVFRGGQLAAREGALAAFAQAVDEVMAVIDSLQPPVADTRAAGAVPPQPPSPRVLQELDQQFLFLDDQLARNMFGAVSDLEALTTQFGSYCDPKQLAAMRRCLDRFDFRGARQLLATIRQEFGLSS